MTGMSRTTGRRLDEVAHIRQSIADILTTPLGSRVMRRDYGSLLPELIDHPQNDATMLQLYAAAVTALITWEPRLRIRRIAYSMDGPTGVLDLEGEFAATGQPFSEQVQLRTGATA